MLDVFMNISPSSSIGKILIQRDEETKLPKLYYSKLPPLAGKSVVILDPMLGTLSPPLSHYHHRHYYRHH
jgi:uracil phosphoribosyltransferase